MSYSLLAGIKAGWRSFVWMCRIVVPVSLLVALLQWSGWLDRADPFLHPIMRLLGLPPEAALPIISGMLVNIYAALGMVAVLPFSSAQMTLIAIFSLIAHNLILEGVIQHRSGINAAKTTLIRVSAAILTVLAVGWFLGDTADSIGAADAAAVRPLFAEMLRVWAFDTGTLLLKILAIVMLVMVALEVARALGWMQRATIAFRPVMKVLGLSDGTTTMFAAGVVFGLLYGGAVIVEEAKKAAPGRGLGRAELECLHISLGINHSMVEDPALFAALGLNAFWLWVPRLVVAIGAVHVYRVLSRLLRRRKPEAGDSADGMNNPIGLEAGHL